MEKINIAICIIAFNRIESLKRTLDSVSKAYYSHEVPLVISVDKSNTSVVEDFADKYLWIHGEKRVIKHDYNLGLRKHVFSCGNLLTNYDALIVLEDDVTVAESFFVYAEQCVAKYSADDNIAGISLYNFSVNYQNQLPFLPIHTDSDVYFMQCAQSWGQVWMQRQWRAFREWYDRHNEEFTAQTNLPLAICAWPSSSWLKYHTRYCIEEHKYFVYPYVSLSTNNNDVGTHLSKSDTFFQTPMLYGKKYQFNLLPTVRYDGFFENAELYQSLGLPREDLCVDFYAEKKNREKCRYWLSREFLPYKILESFALKYKPWELNVINHVAGQDVFLYDTSIYEENKQKLCPLNFIYYIYGIKGLRGIIKRIVRGALFNLTH